MDTLKANATRAAKATRVLNRAPAPIQITAEQLILEARDRGEAAAPPPPKVHVTDAAELAEFRLRKRKEFEDQLRRRRADIGVWLRYAKWEESQLEVERARSIYERALDVDYKVQQIWMRYAEMEMRSKFIARARNVWDRAVTLLPRVDAFWYKYAYMEEVLGNVNGARAVFERWTAWEPPDQAWLSYAKLEERAGERERARAVWERYVACHPSQTSYARFAKWEERGGQRALARRVWERATEELGEAERDAALFSEFARFEERCGEHARATAIYSYALQALAPTVRGYDGLQAAHLAHEKQHGARAGVESAILAKRRDGYRAAVGENPLNYDAWLDWIRLEEAAAAEVAEAEGRGAGGVGDAAAATGGGQASPQPDDALPPPSPALAAAWERVRDVYERAVAQLPPVATEKRFWRRYVYLWINYALWEELSAGDLPRARAIYRAALKVIPHATFTFGKLWLLAAQADVRGHDLPAARKLLGTALGVCPKLSVVRGYIGLELRLGEVDRARRLYEKLLSLWPAATGAGWLRYAELEASLGEDERARAIYELGVGQAELDTPEALWKAYIDFEIGRGEVDRARALYGRLLGRTQHVKVWLSAAAFEASVAGDPVATRGVYARAYDHFKAATASLAAAAGAADAPPVVAAKAARALVVETWRAFEHALRDDEAAHGGDGAASEAVVAAVEAKVPRAVVKRREVAVGGGSARSWEEYTDYLFPDDEVKPSGLKLLALAQKWKAAGGSLTAALGGGEGAAAADAEPLAAEDANALDIDGDADDTDAPLQGGSAVDDDEEHQPSWERPHHAGIGFHDGDGGAASAAAAAGLADGAAGAEEGDYEGPSDRGDGAAPPASKRMRLPAPAFVHAASPDGGGSGDRVPQDVGDEAPREPDGGGASSAAAGDEAGGYPREVERQREDEVRRAPNAAGAPRDWYTEGDAGRDDDRDL